MIKIYLFVVNKINKNMKKAILHTKKLIATIYLGLAGTVLIGQGLYFNIHSGYGFKMGAMNGYVDGVGSVGYSSTERTTYSFGAGFNAGGALGYMLNNHVGLELGASYLIGAKAKTSYIFSNGQDEIITDRAFSSKMFRVMPSILLTPALNFINPYARFGMVIGVGSMERNTDQSYNGSMYVYDEKFNGGVAIGHTSSLGARLKLSEKAGLFIELNAINMAYSPTNRKVIAASENGKDVLPALNTRDKETVYVSSLENTNSNISDSQPEKSLKIAYPFGSIGINIGFNYAF